MRFWTSLLIAGVIAEIAFETYGLVINPALFGFPMEPANLVKGLLGNLLGTEVPYQTAYATHLIVGAIGFPLGYVILRQTILKKVHYLLAGLVYGLILWFVAQGMLAPLVGRSFMMDFAPYTWASLFAHPMMTVIIAIIWNRRMEQGQEALPNSPQI